MHKKTGIKQSMFRMERLRSFSLMKALWLALLSAVLLSVVLLVGAINPDTHRLSPGAHPPFMVGANVLLFGMLYIFNFTLQRLTQRSGIRIVLGLIGSLAVAAGFSLLAWWSEQAIYGSNYSNLPVTMAVNFTTSLIAYLITLLLYNVVCRQQALLENEHLLSENLRIRHHPLEQQLSPHFLFNSLGALDALIGSNEEKAHSYLQQLAASYRYMLQPERVVTLREELQFTQAYIGMMQTRYGEAFQSVLHIDSSLLDKYVPPISVQMLVENALKHNICTVRQPLIVTIESHHRATGDVLTVSNKMNPKDESHPHTGVGLANLTERYRLLFDRRVEVSSHDGIFCVEIAVV